MEICYQVPELAWKNGTHRRQCAFRYTYSTVHKYSANQCSTVHYNIAEYSTVQQSIVKVQYCKVHYSTVQYSIVLYSTVQYSTVHVQYSTTQCRVQYRQFSQRCDSNCSERKQCIFNYVYLVSIHKMYIYSTFIILDTQRHTLTLQIYPAVFLYIY